MNLVLLYRMRLLLLGCCSAAGIVLAFRGFHGFWPLTFALGAMLLSAFSLLRGTDRGWALLLPPVFLCLGLISGGIEASRYKGREGLEEQVVLRGRVEAERRTGEGEYLLLEVREVVTGDLPRRGDLYLLRPPGRPRGPGEGGRGGAGAPRWGEYWKVEGRLRTFSRAEGEAGGILRAFAWSREKGPSSPWLKWAATFRGVVMDERRGKGKEECLIRGMVLGDYRQLGGREIRDLRLSGLLHVCAASGLHVAILLALLIKVIERLGAGRRYSPALALPGVLVYALAAGSSPSVRRAMTMATLAAAASLAGRRPDPVATLGAALLMGALGSPRAVLSISFLLSYSAASGMVILYPVFRERWGRRIPRPAEPLLAALAAQLAVAPVMLGRFGEIPLLAPVSNAVLLPLVPFILLPPLVLGFAGTAWLPVSHLGFALARPFARVFLHAAEIFGALGRRLDLPFFLPAPGLCLLCISLVALGLTRGRAWRMAAVGVASLLVLAVAWNFPVATGLVGREGPSVTFFDVGQGDSALLVGPGGERVLLDGGADPFLVRGKLRALGIHCLDAVICSHGDRDHVGGLAEVLEGLYVGVLARPSLPPGEGAERRLLEAAAAMGVPVVELGGGETVEVGGLALRLVGGPSFLGVGKGSGELQTDFSQNEASLVISLELEGVTFLFPGDVEEEGQECLLERGATVRADVLKVPHHGGFSASTDRFLDAVKPRVAVISVGTPNEYGHPAADTLEALRRRGCRVFRTDESGDIVVRAEEGRIRVEGRGSTSREGGREAGGGDSPPAEIAFAPWPGQVLSLRERPGARGKRPPRWDPVPWGREHDGGAVIEGQGDSPLRGSTLAPGGRAGEAEEVLVQKGGHFPEPPGLRGGRDAFFGGAGGGRGPPLRIGAEVPGGEGSPGPYSLRGKTA